MASVSLFPSFWEAIASKIYFLYLFAHTFSDSKKRYYSAKPSFFHDDSRANLFEVEPKSGMLLNTDNGSPMPQVGIKLLSNVNY